MLTSIYIYGVISHKLRAVTVQAVRATSGGPTAVEHQALRRHVFGGPDQVVKESKNFT